MAAALLQYGLDLSRDDIFSILQYVNAHTDEEGKKLSHMEADSISKPFSISFANVWTMKFKIRRMPVHVADFRM